MLPAPAPVPAPTPGFPDDRSLCERCGYSLRGLPAQGACPECGDPIFNSDPVHRPGLAFQNRQNPRTLAATLWAITFHPKRSFRALRMNHPGDPVWPERVYLLVFVLLIGLFWWGMGSASGLALMWLGPLRFFLSPGVPHPLIEGGVVAAGVVVLTYIEALGVAYFSRRRGWHVALRVAERVSCYSAGAWVPAAMVMFKVRLLQESGTLTNLWPAAVTNVNPYVDFLTMVIVGAVSILWFESLVWLGVREVKYGNRPPG